MAIGSLVTVGVLAVAALQGPKWFRGSEAASVTPPPQQQQQAQTIETQPLQTQPQQQTPPEQTTPVVTSTPPPVTASPEAKRTERTPRTVAQNIPTPQAQPVQTQPVQSTPTPQNPPPQQVQTATPQPPARRRSGESECAPRTPRSHDDAGQPGKLRASNIDPHEGRTGPAGTRHARRYPTAEQRMENYMDDARQRCVPVIPNALRRLCKPRNARSINSIRSLAVSRSPAPDRR